MKYLLCFFLSFSAFAKVSIEKIKSIKHDGALYEIQFMGSSKIFNLSGNNSVFPCLENAEKSAMFVTLETEANEIRSCKLTPNRLPGSFHGKLK